MVRKQRVEVYLHPDVVAQLENDFSESKSAVIRDAINDMLENND